MPYNGRVYRILIASPSDVEEEREIAVRVIQEWNDLYSYSRQVVLLPLRWETHTAPEYGTRPQEVINRAIVDQCDLLLGIFWTRIGTPTGEADSGTLEEIERVAKAGKPVMLYFSKVGVDPDKLDLEQVARLKSFKDQTYPNALTESYKSVIEFRDKLAKQLELKIRDLQKADNPNQPPPLDLQFVSIESGKLLGSSVELSIDLPEIEDVDIALASNKDKDLRERLEKYVNEQKQEATITPVIMAISNSGSSGVRNLYVEMSIQAISGAIEVVDSLPNRGVSYVRLFASSWRESEIEQKLEVLTKEKLRRGVAGWNFSFEWVALQPQRVRIIQPPLFVNTTSTAEVEFTAKVFADSFPQPVSLRAVMLIQAQPKIIKLDELIPNLDEIKSLLATTTHKVGRGAKLITTSTRNAGGKSEESNRK